MEGGFRPCWELSLPRRGGSMKDSAPSGGDRYPILRNIHIDQHRKPFRQPDAEWVAVIAEGIRNGRQMDPIGIEPCRDGGWHVVYHYHTYLAQVEVHGADSTFPVRSTEVAYFHDWEHTLDQAKSQHIKPFSDEDWKAIIENLMASGMTQTQVAQKLGKSKFWASDKL